MQALREWDLNLFRLINIGMHRDWLDPYFTVLSYMGLGAAQAIVCLALLVWKRTRAFAWPLGFASAVAGFVFADGLKQLIPRDRPSNLSWAIAQEPFRSHSFPSGHTASSFGFAIMLLLIVYRSDLRWAGWLAIVWALMVGLSRVYRGVHWPTDVLAGALCGFLGAGIVYLVFESKGWLPDLSASEETSP